MTWRGKWPPSAAETPCPRRRAKGDRTPSMVSCPLLTPLTFLLALTHRRCAAKRGLRGLGSVRRADFETFSGPEFSLRDLQRCQCAARRCRARTPSLRKAPLPSRVYPWSTKRPCGPLAFRRATEGSRVQRKGWGVKRGRETLVSLPLLPPPPDGGNAQPAHRQPISPAAAGRRNGGTAHPLLRAKTMAHRCIGGRFRDCKSYNYTEGIENDRLRIGDGRLVFYDKRFLKSS